MSTMAPEEATSALQAQTQNYQASASALVITSEAAYEAAGVLIRALRDLADSVRDTFREPKRKAHEAHKSMVATENGFLAPIERAQAVVRGKMVVYAEARERERRAAAIEAERVAREAEEMLRLEEAAVLESLGDHAGALAMLDAPLPVPVAPSEKLAAEGITVRETWHAELVDLRLLVAEVAAGRAPLTLLALDEPAANAFARSTRGSVEVPGLRIFPRTGLAVRS